MRGRLALITAIVISAGVTAHGADLLVPSQHPTIQAAIDAAQPGDVVIVADGMHRGQGFRDVSFMGKAITVRSAHGPAACVIDCAGTPQLPFRGFVFSSGEGPDSVLEGFTICNGATLPGAIADQFNGGAILCTEQSSPTIRDCTLIDNWAGCWGGAICCSFESHPVIERCTIAGNYSDDDGGGIFAWAGSVPTIRDTVISGNESRLTGGGITIFSGAQVINTTIAGNQAISGAGVYAQASTTFVNTVIWGNDGDLDVRGNPIITYSLIEDGYPGAGNLELAPNFVDASAGDYRLAANSPLIDAGDAATPPDGDGVDADGAPRVVGAVVDIGAFEFQGEPCRADLDGNGTIGFADLVTLLSLWGTCTCNADLDGSGSVDFGDMLDLLSRWGDCP